MMTSTLLKKSLMAAASVACVAASTLSSTAASAATFNGSLTNGQTQTGTVAPGNNIGNSNGWSFWQFLGDAGDTATLTVRRLAGGLDPAFGVWFGTESNISNYSSIFSNSANTPLVASADDELPPAISGPFGDPQTGFTLGSTGLYTIAVSSFASSPSNDPFPYSITLNGSGATPVPTPALLPGLIGLGVGVLRKRKAEAAKQTSEV